MTEESGTPGTDTNPVPVSAATACLSAYPGTCAARRPATTPRNRAGKFGPPRKLPSEIDQANPLKRSKSARLDNEIVAANSKSDPNAT